MSLSLEQQVIQHLRQKGPLTGLELRGAFGVDSLLLWQTCGRASELAITTIGTRYLRLDRRVEGFARLSPSILREFLSYSVVGLAENSAAITRRACEIAAHIETVSQHKRELADRIVSSVMQQVAATSENLPQMCFIIAGDIAYGMANDARRPEQSTGEFVRGSDIDLVVVLEDSASDELVQNLDNAIYGEKYRALIAPECREELDYVIKRMSRVKEQLQFATFKQMVACKILREGRLLYGSESLFADIKTLLDTHGVTGKIEELEKKAQILRREAEEYLRHANPDDARRESLDLFFPAEESEEFE